MDFDGHDNKTTMAKKDTISHTVTINHSNYHILDGNEMYKGQYKNGQIKNIFNNNSKKDKFSQSILQINIPHSLKKIFATTVT